MRARTAEKIPRRKTPVQSKATPDHASLESAGMNIAFLLQKYAARIRHLNWAPKNRRSHEGVFRPEWPDEISLWKNPGFRN
jgi:hypothetical protein